MKNICFFIFIFMFASSSYAQFAGALNSFEKSTGETNQKKNLLIIDFGLGLNSPGDGTILNVGLHDIYKFNSNIGWDVLGINAIVSTDNLENWILQPMTGLYLESNKVSGFSFYTDTRIGYAFDSRDIDFSADDLGYSLDITVGLNINSYLNMGYTYNYIHRGSVRDSRIHFLRVGYRF